MRADGACWASTTRPRSAARPSSRCFAQTREPEHQKKAVRHLTLRATTSGRSTPGAPARDIEIRSGPIAWASSTGKSSTPKSPTTSNRFAAAQARVDRAAAIRDPRGRAQRSAPGSFPFASSAEMIVEWLNSSVRQLPVLDIQRGCDVAARQRHPRAPASSAWCRCAASSATLRNAAGVSCSASRDMSSTRRSLPLRLVELALDRAQRVDDQRTGGRAAAVEHRDQHRLAAIHVEIDALPSWFSNFSCIWYSDAVDRSRRRSASSAGRREREQPRRARGHGVSPRRRAAKPMEPELYDAFMLDNIAMRIIMA